ncbi:hypothetical protein KC957_03905, partial [Candidatus Saccharibacteria bacterium]|nr:hypothetical protein [Candidatus Saccharibacteria bacterium]
MTRECESLIGSKTSFNLVATAGVGVTFFVKYLDARSSADFIYVNPYEMHEVTQAAVYAQLAEKLDLPGSASLADIRDRLGNVIGSERTVVLLFNRFDRIRRVVDAQFYDNIRFLRDVNRARVVVGFVTTEPMVEAVPAEASEFMSLVSRTVYFSGYNEADMQELLAAGGSRGATNQELTLAGGHHLLLQVVMGCQDPSNALSDPMVELLVRDIVSGLSSRRRRLLTRIIGTQKEVQDTYLLQTKFVQNGGEWHAFSPLVDEYIGRASQARLPVKEQRLLDVLLQYKGEVVAKE